MAVAHRQGQADRGGGRHLCGRDRHRVAVVRADARRPCRRAPGVGVPGCGRGRRGRRRRPAAARRDRDRDPAQHRERRRQRELTSVDSALAPSFALHPGPRTAVERASRVPRTRTLQHNDMARFGGRAAYATSNAVPARKGGFFRCRRVPSGGARGSARRRPFVLEPEQGDAGGCRGRCGRASRARGAARSRGLWRSAAGSGAASSSARRASAGTRSRRPRGARSARPPSCRRTPRRRSSTMRPRARKSSVIGVPGYGVGCWM